MQLFYNKDITFGGYCTLDVEESRHAVRVLRMREGDGIFVTDGRGSLYRCVIIEANDRSCTVEPLSVATSHNQQEYAVSLHLAVAPTKNPARMEWLVEKAVELGVGEITLLQCDHSERTFLKTDRLEKLAVSAMKQSLHTMLPRINPPVNLKDWMNSQQMSFNSQLKFIAHCESYKPRTPLVSVLIPKSDPTILIGPEGDFSEEEIALALQHGFHPVSLGSSRLRTETAALYAVAVFNIVNEAER